MTKLIKFEGPRKIVEGKTGTYQIVFIDGMMVTLEHVALEYTGNNNSEPRFVYFIESKSNSYPVSFSPSDDNGNLDPKSIVGIFRLHEDILP